MMAGVQSRRTMHLMVAMCLWCYEYSVMINSFQPVVPACGGVYIWQVISLKPCSAKTLCGTVSLVWSSMTVVR